MSQPWMKFYPRDWRGDQALRAVSLAARGLWMEMLCIMHEASPRGHLIIGANPVTDDVLARSVGAGTGEVQAMLVELSNAGVFDRSRNGVILSRRMIADEKKAKAGRNAKLEALGKKGENGGPSRSPSRVPSPQKPEARGKVEGPNRPSTLTEAKEDSNFDLKEDRQPSGPASGDGVIDWAEVRWKIFIESLAMDAAKAKAVS